MSKASDADQDFIAAAMPAFISEAGEQTEAIETLLLELEEQPDDRELLDSLFRCAHTVKGSAGIFGLNKVVEFTHHVETLLDQMREGKLHLNPTLSTLLLQCNDQIKFLVDTASDEAADTADQKDLRADLVIQLRAYTEGAAPKPAPSAASATGGCDRRWRYHGPGTLPQLRRPDRVADFGPLWPGNLSQRHGPAVDCQVP